MEGLLLLLLYFFHIPLDAKCLGCRGVLFLSPLTDLRPTSLRLPSSEFFSTFCPLVFPFNSFMREKIYSKVFFHPFSFSSNSSFFPLRASFISSYSFISLAYSMVCFLSGASHCCLTPHFGCSDISPSTVFVVVIRQSDWSLHGGIVHVGESSLHWIGQSA